MSAGVLISYFDASSKAFDYQSKNPGARGVRVANLTRKASLIRRLERAARESLVSVPICSVREGPAERFATSTGFYNAASMQAHL